MPRHFSKTDSRDLDDFAPSLQAKAHFGPRRTDGPITTTKSSMNLDSPPLKGKRLRKAGEMRDEEEKSRKRIASEEIVNITSPTSSAPTSSPSSSAQVSDGTSSPVQILTSPNEKAAALDTKLKKFKVDSAGPSSRSSSMSRNGSVTNANQVNNNTNGNGNSMTNSKSGLANQEIIVVGSDSDSASESKSGSRSQSSSEAEEELDVEMQVIELNGSSSPVKPRKGRLIRGGRPTQPDQTEGVESSSTGDLSDPNNVPLTGQNKAFDRFEVLLQATGGDYTRQQKYKAFVEAEGDQQKGVQLLLKLRKDAKSTLGTTATTNSRPVGGVTTITTTTTTTTNSSKSTPNPSTSNTTAGSRPPPPKLVPQNEADRRIETARTNFGHRRQVNQELINGARCLLDERHFHAFAKVWSLEDKGLSEKDQKSLGLYRKFIQVHLSRTDSHLPPNSRKGPSSQNQAKIGQNGTAGGAVNGKSFYGKPSTSKMVKPPPVSTYRPVQTSGSILERQLAAAAQLNRPKKKKKVVDKKSKLDEDGSDIDIEDGAYDSDNSADQYDGRLDERAIRESETIAVEWFNTCSKEQLMELASCTIDQAEITISLRPFEDAEDFRSRTRKRKGVGNGMLDSYLEVIAGMQEVDRILRDCERIGEELSATMKIWLDAGDSKGTAATTTTTTLNADVGLNLVAVSDENVVARSEDPKVRKAFEGYLWKQPEGVPDQITLKDYQLLGVNWLHLLYKKGLSCILADEMGLGKTAQVIALLSHLKAIGEPGPHLVVVPSSTLENWRREFNTFAPDLVVESYYGSQAEREELRYELREMKDLDVVVTTYNQATSSAEDQKFLKRKLDFKVAIFDEGHMLKNSASKKHEALMQIRAKWRLLLTGTPLQNNLQELVSLLSFILPDQFRDSAASLRAIFKVAPGQSANLLSRERISRAKKMMTPFVLRRKKAQVLKDLPKKYERIEWCEMTDLQRDVYQETMFRSKKALMNADEADLELDDDADEDKPKKVVAKKNQTTSHSGRKSDKTSSSHVLMDLRKAASHPMLFRRLYTDKMLRVMAKDCLKELEFMDSNPVLVEEDLGVMTDFELHRFASGYKHLQKHALVNDEWMSAGKIHFLQETIPKLKANGDRILLFSQFTMILDILEVVLDTIGIKYLKLTGQTNVTDRQDLCDAYTNDPDITVFLLSTRAGGLGLNLTAANTVIFYDQDYNPHNDKQAEDRSYRIGQTRDVQIIKLITKDSLEEQMLQLASDKLKLDSEVSGLNEKASSNGAAEVKTIDDNGADVEDAKASEKMVKKSLLATLKKNFEAGQSASQAPPSTSSSQTLASSPGK